MSIELAETLKKDWTDKYVVVVEGVPELRRFVGLTGTVKTVNMNCKALVQFDSPEDISWYDIDTSYLKTVDAPAKKKAAGHAAEPAEKAAKAAPAKKPGMSPLEMARQQGAAGGAKATAAPAAKAGAPKGEAKKLSPLELARQQGAAGSAGAAKAAAPAAPKAAAAPAAEGKKLSPLELARQQGAAGTGGAAKASAAAPAKPAAAPSKPAAEEAEEPTPAPAPAKPAKAADAPKAATTGPDGKKLSPLELARLQGPFKG